MGERQNYFSALDIDSDEETLPQPSKASSSSAKNAKKKDSNPKKNSNAASKKSSNATAKKAAPAASSGKQSQPARSGHRAPKREFDRHSGTGRGKETKKGGGGKHNWGKPGTGYTGDARQADQVKEREETGGGKEKPEEEGEQAEEGQEQVEEQVKNLTLEEYEQQRKGKRQGKGFENVQLRRAEGPTEGVAYSKKPQEKLQDDEESFIALGGGKKKNNQGNKQKKDQRKKMLDTNFQIRDPNQFSGERSREGFRGGRGRGRGGRGGSRGGRSNNNDQDGGRSGFRATDNKEAFPSLS